MAYPWRIGIRDYAEAWLAFKQLRVQQQVTINTPTSRHWKTIREDGWLEGLSVFGDPDKRFIEKMCSSPHYFRVGFDRFGADLMPWDGTYCIMPENLRGILAKHLNKSESDLFTVHEVEKAIVHLNLDAGRDLVKRGELAEAFHSFHLAAELGEAEAQLALGRMYFEGNGVPQNTILAHKWFNLAASSLAGEMKSQALALREQASARLTAERRLEAEESAQAWRPKTWDVLEQDKDVS